MADAAGAVQAAVRERPDICLLDVKMPGSGLSAAWEITGRLPRAKIVMLTVSGEDADLFAALRAGAAGYLLKTMDFAGLPDILNGVCAGEAAIPPALVTRLLGRFRTREPRWRRPLDHGYAEQYEKQSGKKADWFTTHGDVFPVGKTKMTPFPPVSPDGRRSFPSKRLSKGVSAKFGAS